MINDMNHATLQSVIRAGRQDINPLSTAYSIFS